MDEGYGGREAERDIKHQKTEGSGGANDFL